jgi:hypothetical protein
LLVEDRGHHNSTSRPNLNERGIFSCFYRELYVILIIMADMSGGRKAGLTASIIVTIFRVYMVMLLLRVFERTGMAGYNGPRLAFSNLTGFIAGAYSEW